MKLKWSEEEKKGGKMYNLDAYDDYFDVGCLVGVVVIYLDPGK